MSVSNDSTGISTIDDGRALLSPTFLKFCAKVRNNDPSILPKLGKPFKIGPLSEGESIEVADALLENTSVKYLELEVADYTATSAKAMAKYLRTSTHLQHIRWDVDRDAELRQCEEVLCCFLPAIQESTSLKELQISFTVTGGPSDLALENMLTHTQSLRSLSLFFPEGILEDIVVAAARSGLKENTTLRELKLEFPRGATTISPIFTSLRDHPLLQKLCVRGQVVDLTGLETLLLSDNSIITELEIRKTWGDQPIVGLTHVLGALARNPTLTKLGLRHCPLDHDKARLLRVALCNTKSLQSLVLTHGTLGSAGLAELAQALYHNASIKVLDISNNYLNDLQSAELLRDILRSNKTITTIDLSMNRFGRKTGTVECIMGGLGSNSTLLNIDLSSCDLGAGGVSTLAQNLGSRTMTLQKLTLCNNAIGATGVGVLLETMEQNIPRITDLDLHYNYIGSEGAGLLARSLGNNALANLTSLSLTAYGVGDNGFIVLLSALEENTSLLHLDLRHHIPTLSERAFLALAESLPEIKVLQRLDFSWCTGLVSAMPSLLAGLCKNTSLFRFHVANCAPSSVPTSPEETARCSGGWMQEMERLGYRNRFRDLILEPNERLPPSSLWPHALA
jgi:Leucine-rich repeat (LRR) protein